MGKRINKSEPVAVSAQTIRRAFQSGDLDHTVVPALNAKGEPKTDKGGNVVVADPACLFSGPQGKGRGRLNPAFVKAFLDANPGTTYAEKAVKSDGPERTITLPLTKMNKRGARVKRPEDFPASRVRALAGVGPKGRIPQTALTKAAEAVMAERGWDHKPQ